MITIIALPLIAYLSGSVPWGLIITRAFISIDIRQHGSGNIGATNVRRVAGNIPGLLTLAGDIMKGAIPVFAAVLFVSRDKSWYELYVSIVALAAFMGHLYPVFTMFRTGGKGVATAAGIFLVLSPMACIIALMVFILVAWLNNHVSLGSLSAAACLPLSIWLVTRSTTLSGCGLIITIFIFIRHRSNIKRLLSGSEPGFRDKNQ